MSEGISPQVTISDVMDAENIDELSDNNTNINALQQNLLERQTLLSNFQLQSFGGFSSYMPQNPSDNVNINNQAINMKPKDNQDNPENVVVVQNEPPTMSGADIYTTVLNKKRRLSPPARRIVKIQKGPKKVNNTLVTKNRFSIFDFQKNEKSKNEPEKVTIEKPTPFYVRGEKSTSEIRKWMNELEIADYDIKVLYNGHEAKLQLKTIKEYRKGQTFFEQNNIPNYTYQLKSARSVRAVIKGLDPRIDTDEISEALKNLNFMPRNVFKTKNKNGERSSVVLVELEPRKDNGKSHPIFELKRLLNMVILVEVPRKQNQPKQCYNCQEYGHTKNRCFLTPICAICAEKHSTNQCDKDKNNKEAKVCNNCGKNHTANWKGCEVYQVLLERLNPKQRREQRIANNQQKFNTNEKKQNLEPQVIKGVSYANVLTGNVNHNNKNDESFNSNDLIKLMFMMQSNMQALQVNISEIIKKQNALENSIVEINKMLSKISKQK